MKKKAIIISMIAGIFILGLCVWSAVGSGDVPAVENASVEGSASADGLNEWSGQETSEPKSLGKYRRKVRCRNRWRWKRNRKCESRKDIIRVFLKEIDFVEPIVKLNGEEGILDFFWNRDCIRVDADTLLLAIDCYFAEEKLQQKIFFLAEAPDFTLREVFRQDTKIWDEELRFPQCLEWRMKRPHPVDGGYIYEVDGELYFLDRDFKEAHPFCDLRELMGDYYLFSPSTFNICDVTEDVSRMLVCMDDGLYEYDLENGERKLLEPAYFAPREIMEGDCSCGSDFWFSGPARAEYGPDGQSYAFLTGTEEVDWGVITGAVLRSGEGKTLYQKEETEDGIEYVNDFKWIELEDATYLAVFYDKYVGEKYSYSRLMDRVNINTGEVETFEVPGGVYWANGCVRVGFLDADTLLYISYDEPSPEYGGNVYVYQLSSKKQLDLEVTGEVDWEIMVLDVGGYEAYPVRYPK